MNWQDVDVEQLIEIAELSDLTPTEYKLERISIVTGEYYDDLDEDGLDELLNEFAWLDEPIKTEPTGRKYNKLTWGTLIDINKFVTGKKPLENFDKIIAVVDGYEDFTIKCNLIRKEPCTKYYAVLEEVLQYRQKLLENYEDLFTSDDDEPNEDDEPIPQEEIVYNRWAWERLTYDLAGGDITKVQAIMDLPHLMVLNWLTMIKDLKLGQQSRSVQNPD